MFDLSGRQQAVLVAVCCLLDGAALLVAWVLRPNLAWDHPLPVIFVLSTAVGCLAITVEDRPFWLRLTQPRQPSKRRQQVQLRALNLDQAEAARGGIRTRVLRAVAWRALVAVAMAASVLVSAASLAGSGAEHDQRLVREQPHLVAEVVEVKRDKWTRSPNYTVNIKLLDGRRAELANGEELKLQPQAGDAVEVVVDPADPDLVLAVAAVTGIDLVDHVIDVVFLLTLASLTGYLGVRWSHHPIASWRPLLHQTRHPHSDAAEPAPVVEAEVVKVTTSRTAWTIHLHVNDRRWRWRVHQPRTAPPEPGTRLPVYGPIAKDAWLVGLTSPTLTWPKQGLMPLGGATPTSATQPPGEGKDLPFELH